MIRNTRELVQTLKVWIGGVSLLTAGLAGMAIMRGLKKRKKYHRPYSPDTFEEISGKIKKIYSPGDDRHNARGVVLVLIHQDEEFPVHLGPYWFVNRQFKRFKIGEKITVSGSHVHYDGQDILVADTLQRNKHTYRLRNKTGAPYWDAKIS